MKDKNKVLICNDCFRLQKCKERSVSWIFFFIALLATIAIRAVNVFINTHPVIAKLSWYVGIVGFLVFFAYKFRNDNILHRELGRTDLIEKVLARKGLDSSDYELMGTILCRLRSKKDKINYFFIFFFSVLALVWGLYADLFK